MDEPLLYIHSDLADGSRPKPLEMVPELSGDSWSEHSKKRAKSLSILQQRTSVCRRKCIHELHPRFAKKVYSASQMTDRARLAEVRKLEGGNLQLRFIVWNCNTS
jgi:hypothetical protein